MRARIREKSNTKKGNEAKKLMKKSTKERRNKSENQNIRRNRLGAVEKKREEGGCDERTLFRKQHVVLPKNVRKEGDKGKEDGKDTEMEVLCLLTTVLIASETCKQGSCGKCEREGAFPRPFQFLVPEQSVEKVVTFKLQTALS